MTQKEILMGPTCSGIDLTYIQGVLSAGGGEYLDVITVHPYRSGPPESVSNDFKNLRNLISSFNLTLPIFSGEWGYPTCKDPCVPGGFSGMNEDIQAKYLARQWMINAMNGIGISIWYDFKDDGTNETMREETFGTVGYQYFNSTLPQCNGCHSLAVLMCFQ